MKTKGNNNAALEQRMLARAIVGLPLLLDERLVQKNGCPRRIEIPGEELRRTYYKYLPTVGLT